jgi:hypothetical protein
VATLPPARGRYRRAVEHRQRTGRRHPRHVQGKLTWTVGKITRHPSTATVHEGMGFGADRVADDPMLLVGKLDP